MRENFMSYGKTPVDALVDINMDKVDAFLQSTKKKRVESIKKPVDHSRNKNKLNSFIDENPFKAKKERKIRKKNTIPEILIRYDFRGIELSIGDDISFYTRSEACLETGVITKINNYSATILSNGHIKHRFYKQISKFKK